jgi:hypothetical protein
VRQRVDDVSRQSRTATGVLMQRLGADDRVLRVATVPNDSSDDWRAIDSSAAEHEAPSHEVTAVDVDAIMSV